MSTEQDLKPQPSRFQVENAPWVRSSWTPPAEWLPMATSLLMDLHSQIEDYFSPRKYGPGDTRLPVTIPLEFMEAMLGMEKTRFRAAEFSAQHNAIRLFPEEVKNPEPLSVPVAGLVAKPWGHYLDLFRSQQFVLKEITLFPGARLSLQRHTDRAELWYAHKTPFLAHTEARTGSQAPWGCTRLLERGEVMTVPPGLIHRAENDSDQPTSFLELQVATGGQGCREEDIERLEDDFGRVPEKA